MNEHVHLGELHMTSGDLPATPWPYIERGVSLSGKTYRRIKDLLLSCELEPGKPLNEIALSRRLGISRSPLREALRQLQEECLVETWARGVRATPVTRRGILELYELRLALESFAARQAAGRIKDDDVAVAEAGLEQTAAPLAKGDVRPFTNSDFEFHDLYVRNCGNTLLIDRIGRLRDHLRRVWNHVGIRIEDTILAYQEHLEILAAIRTADSVILQQAVERHIAAVGKRVSACVIDDG